LKKQTPLGKIVFFFFLLENSSYESFIFFLNLFTTAGIYILNFSLPNGGVYQYINKNTMDE